MSTFLPDDHIQWIRDETCPMSQDVLSAANLMKSRLTNYIKGGASAVPGFSFDAPSHFLGIYGLVESLLYTIRLYHLVYLKRHSEVSEPMTENHYVNFIADIENAIQHCRYESDLLARHLPSWVNHLKEIALHDFGVEEIAAHDQPDGNNVCAVSDAENVISIQNLPTILHELTSEKFISSNPRVKGKQHTTDTVATVALSNGVMMPLVGLGTWKLNDKTCEDTVAAALDLGYRHFDTAQGKSENETDNEYEISSTSSTSSFIYL